MLIRRVGLAAAVAAAFTALAVPSAGAVASGHRPGPQAISITSVAKPAVARIAGLPQGVPKAALLPQPQLPEPARSAWPFPNEFPRTSGTGRLGGGASFWTDWLYDDHGAAAPTGLPIAASAITSLLAGTQGLASYPAGPAHGNGADIFRAAVGVTSTASYWRVDWNTLVDPDVPIAEWAFDTDDNASTGSSAWPGDAGVHSPGVDEALLVSAKAVQLVDLDNGRTTNVLTQGGALTVDRASRSFVVRVPRTLLPVGGNWRIRLASGLASADGRSFAAADYAGLNAPQAALGQLPRVYNVTFRTLKQEPPVYRNGQTDAQISALQTLLAGTPIDGVLGADGLARVVTGNFWMEDHQADALASGDVAPFSQVISWSALAKHDATPEPQPHGYSNRWYVSRLKLGQGVVSNAGGVASTGDLRPNYLSRVQPYAVYVPRHLSLGQPRPLTWILHSLDVNLNQYGALDPRLLQQECQDRQSICATTEGFGPDGWYFDEAEQDFWSVWHALAQSYRLDPTRTVMSGYSMGGWASYKLTLEHPDLFSQAMPLEGPPNCGIRIIELGGQQISIPATAMGSTDASTKQHCGSDGFSHPLLGNAKWVPYVVTQGGIDELVPLPSDVQATNDMQELGDRYTFFFLPADDHLAYATQDRFGGIVRALGAQVPKVTRNPGSIVYRWYPDLDNSRLGIGTTTAYWITHLAASTKAAGAVASVQARSFGIAERPITVVNHAPQVVANPLPATETRLTWRRGPKPTTSDRLVLRLSSVRALTINLTRARLDCPTVTVTSDRPVRVTLTHQPGAADYVAGAATLRFPAGDHTRHLTCLPIDY